MLLALATYVSPVHYDISLAGNFGEPRPNHFHGGIDVKTGGVEGKPLFSIADGYVAQVTVGIGGYGNALYIRHPEGYTSVYAHLQKFAPQIERVVKQWQYAHQTEKGTMTFAPHQLPVAKGQLVAVSGNSGSSQAPHLHLEIHDTHSWDMLDPLDFIGHQVEDAMPPMAHGFMAYPVRGQGSFCNGTAKQSFAFTSYHLNRSFTAWGKVGFGIWGNDYMEITYNRYGVRKTELLVDGKSVFKSELNRIPADMNMMVNSWGDYEHYQRYNVWYMRSYVMPGIALPVFTTNADGGIVNFNEERPYQLTYVLTDFKGNSREYTFTVTGKRTEVTNRLPAARPLHVLRWNRPNSYQLPGMQLNFGAGFLPEDTELSPMVESGAYSRRYTFSRSSLPLFYYANLALKLTTPVRDPSKLYVVCHSFRDLNMGGYYKNGWVHAKARDLGHSYEIAYDDVPPIINPVNQGAWNAHGVITIGIEDAQSGVKSYKAYVDGTFVLFKDVPKSPWVRCHLKDTPIRKNGTPHSFKFVLTDERNNIRVYTSTINY